jgi:hypothetical protein
MKSEQSLMTRWNLRKWTGKLEEKSAFQRLRVFLKCSASEQGHLNDV